MFDKTYKEGGKHLADKWSNAKKPRKRILEIDIWNICEKQDTGWR